MTEKNSQPAAPVRRQLLVAGAAAALPWPAWAQAPASAPAKPDAARFFRAPQMTGAALSPDGKRLAIRTLAAHGRAVLSVLNLETMTPVLVYGSDAADVNQFVWVNNERLAFDLTDRETPAGKIDAAPGLFAVDPDGQNLKQLVERQRAWLKDGNDSRKLQPWNTFLLNGTTLRQSDEVLVVRPEVITEKNVDYLKLLRLNTRTGRSVEVEGPARSVGWWPDANGDLRVAQTHEGDQGSLRWKDPASGQWRTLSEFKVFGTDGDLRVRHVAADGRLYVTARRGADKQAMWLLDPATGEWSKAPLAQSPQFDVDAAVVANKARVLGLRFTIDAEVTQWLDPAMKALQAQIDQALPNTVNRLSVPWSGEAPWVLVEAFADVQPTLYRLFNRTKAKFTRLGAERPDIDPKRMAGMDMVRFKARDGLEIPAWLTLPPGITAEQKPRLPMVVLVHGGPWARAPAWQFDAEVQLLAARGYAVLQPQFRGTLGFGAAHERAGWRQWGKAMQTDVADATRWAIDQGLADPRRIAIAGASYGGYATLMGLLRDPDLFRCGVAWVAVTDLEMMYTVDWSDFSDDYKKYGMPTLVGDRIKDAADLKDNSPLTHAARIKQPLLLAHGEKDRRVPLVHGENFRRAVQATNPQVEWIEYPDEGHGWRVPAHQIDFWNRSLRFLDQHLAKP